jgi:predicted ABC-type ATPase
MMVVAGPPGSGKSSRFPIASFKVDCFNADDRAAELNQGSFQKIPAGIRTQVNLDFQKWILNHISTRKSFAIETTLRSAITFEQSRLAREHGFWTAMNYVWVGSVEECIRRIMERAYRGGHSASKRLVREIYEKSTKNLLLALDFAESGIEMMRIYDNSAVGEQVRPLLSLRRGEPQWIAPETPALLESLFKGTEFDLIRLREIVAARSRADDHSPER